MKFFENIDLNNLDEFDKEFNKQEKILFWGMMIVVVLLIGFVTDFR